MWNLTGQFIGMARLKMESKYLQALIFYQIEAGEDYTDTRKMAILK